MTLYEELGVAKDASTADIRKSYRRRAKKTHPDVGGEPGEFERLSRAYATLTNPAKRAKYDQTGTVDDAPIQTEMQEALSVIMPIVISAVQAWSKGTCIDLETEPLLLRLREALGKNKLQIKQEVERADRMRDKLRSMAKRTLSKKKGETSPLARAMEAEAASLDRSTEKGRDQLRMIEAAFKLLSDSTFNPMKAANDPPPAGVGGGFIVLSF